MLDLLTSSGNHRSERGLVRRIRYLLFKLTLAHARTMVVHSACCICLLAQVTTAVCADSCGALATCYCSLALRMPAPWPVHTMHAELLLAQVTTAVRGWYGAFATCYASLPLCVPAPWPVHSAC